MITSDQIRQSLGSRGITIPDFEIESILCLVGSIVDCLDYNYDDDCTKKSILLWSAILIGSSVSARYLSSESAPSGAGRSFGYGSKPWLSLYNQLNRLDYRGCSISIVSAPVGSPSAIFFVSTGNQSNV